MKGKPRRVPGEGYEGVSVQKLENQPGARGHPSRLPGGGARGEPGPRWSRAEGRVPRGQGRVAAASRPLPRWCRAAGARVPWSGGQRPSPASAPRQVWPCDLGFSPRHVGHEEPRGGCGGRFCTALLRYRGGGRSASAGQGGAGPGWAVGAAHRSHVLTSLPQRLARFLLDAQARPSRCPQQRRRALRRRGAPTPGQRGAKRSELAIPAAARKGSGARGRRQEEDNGPAQGKLSVWQRERLRREGLAVLPSLRGLRPGSPRAAWDAKAAEPPGTGT